MSVLVVAAHPDDELLGCGGTIVRESASRPVHIVILGEGLSSRLPQRGGVDPEALRRLHADADRVGRLLGAESVRVLGLPDNRFDELPMLDVVKQVEAEVARVSPETIYTHHPGDLNIDHGITCRAVLTATRPLAGGIVRDIYAFEVASSTEWSFGQVAGPFVPNLFVEIGDAIERKIEGMAMYESEARPFPHPRSGEALRARARHWGSVSGLQFAEAFQIIRSIRR